MKYDSSFSYLPQCCHKTISHKSFFNGQSNRVKIRALDSSALKIKKCCSHVFTCVIFFLIFFYMDKEHVNRQGTQRSNTKETDKKYYSFNTIKIVWCLILLRIMKWRSLIKSWVVFSDGLWIFTHKTQNLLSEKDFLCEY